MLTYPFSKFKLSKSHLGNPWRYQGKHHDEESGLIYFGVRYYNPQEGQWISEDPLDNRRLEVFRRAGIKVPYRMASHEEILSESWKFTTTNQGKSILIRGK